MAKPSHEPASPKKARKGSSSTDLPCARQAARKRRWARQMPTAGERGVSFDLTCPRSGMRLTPRDERRQTCDGHEPIEHSRPRCRQVDIRQQPPREHKHDRPQRPAGLIDVSEAPRREACLGEGGEDARAGVYAGETNGEDRDANGQVDDVW